MCTSRSQRAFSIHYLRNKLTKTTSSLINSRDKKKCEAIKLANVFVKVSNLYRRFKEEVGDEIDFETLLSIFR